MTCYVLSGTLNPTHSLTRRLLRALFVSDTVQDLLHGFPDRCHRLQRYREELQSFQRLRWDEVWNDIVRPLFDDN